MPNNTETPLIERMIGLVDEITSEPELAVYDRHAPIWVGHNSAVSAAASLVQDSINEVAKMPTPNPHGSYCVDSRDVLKLLGQPVVGKL